MRRRDAAVCAVGAAAAVALVLFGRPAGWLLLAAGLPAVFRVERGYVLGPLAGPMLARTARKRRIGPGAALAGLLALAVFQAVWFRTFSGDWLEGRFVPGRELLEFAAACWQVALVFAVGVCTFGAAAGAAALIAGERDRDTLDFLLLADVSGRELVLSKLTAFVVPAGYLALGLAPAAAVLVAVGRPPLDLLGAACLAVAVTHLGVSAVGMLCSVGAAGEPRASSRALVAVFGYVGAASWLKFGLPGVLAVPAWLGGLIDGVNAGNPLAAAVRLARSGPLPDDWRAEVPGVLADYALFHGLLFVSAVLLAAGRLRRVEVRKNDPVAERKAAPRPPRLRPVTDRPVLWKAIHLDGRWARGPAAQVVFVVTALASMVPLAALIATASGPRDTEGVHMLVRAGGACVAVILWMVVSQTAARSFGRERDAGTLDALLLTDLTPTELLWQKWLGAVWPARWAAAWLAAHWLAGVLAGGVAPWSVPLVALVVALGAAAAAGVGLSFSVSRPTTALATSEAIGAVSLAVAAVWGAWWVPSRLLPSDHWLVELLFRQAVTMTPPAMVALLTCSAEEAAAFLRRPDALWWVGQGVLGTAVLAYVARRAWVQALVGFNRVLVPVAERPAGGVP